jgi:serine/threonine-protein kinase
MESLQRQPGELVLDKYQIVQTLNVSSDGLLYEAINIETGIHVALQEIKADDPDYQAFEKRFAFQVRLNPRMAGYPVLAVYGSGVDTEGNLFLVKELEAAGAFRAGLLKMGGRPVRYNEFVLISVQILNTLAQIHNHPLGIIHCDLRPENIYVKPDLSIKFDNFGKAQIVRSDILFNPLHDDHDLKPTYYNAPEQEVITVPVSKATDTYAVGCIFYEMLTGKRYKDVYQLPPSQLNPDISPEIDYVISKALKGDPNQRYARAEDFERDLSLAIQGTRQSPKFVQLEESAVLTTAL